MSGMNRNARVGLTLAGVVLLMVSLSFAAVPFYSWFCRTTGYGGTPSVAEKAPDQVLERLVTVRFDANVAPGLDWEFRPVEQELTLRLGETGLAFYEAYNPTDRATAGQAAFNVAPDSAGRFFDKIACFCFELQVLGPGERVLMPVSFFVDPKMVEDGDAARIRSITLSYTMFQTELPPEYEAQASAPAVEPAAWVAEGPDARKRTTIEQ